jgi:hypothetical protein
MNNMKLINIKFMNGIQSHVVNFTLFVIVCGMLYFSLIPYDYIKYLILVLTIGYYGLVDIRYALLLLFIFALIENNNQNIEKFVSFDKKHREKIFNTIDDSIVNISNVVSEEIENEEENKEENEEEQSQNYKNMFNNDPKSFSEMIDDEQYEEQIEPFVDLNAITGTFLKVGETIHNNNNLDKLKKNLRRGVRSAMKIIQEESAEDKEEETANKQENKIKKQNSHYKKEITTSENEEKEQSETVDDSNDDTNEEDNETEDNSDTESNDGIEGFKSHIQPWMKLKDEDEKKKMKKKMKKKLKNIKLKNMKPKEMKSKYNIFEHLQNNKENEDKIDNLQENINDKLGQIGDFLTNIKKN